MTDKVKYEQQILFEEQEVTLNSSDDTVEQQLIVALNDELARRIASGEVTASNS